MASRSTTVKAGIVLIAGLPLTYLLMRPPDSVAVLGVTIGFILLLGGAFSLIGRLVSFADRTAVTFGALIVILLAAAIRAAAWVRNDRGGKATV